MTELIVKINDLTSIATVKKAILLLRGVDSVSERKIPIVSKTQRVEEDAIPLEIKSLIGIVPQYSEKDLREDDRLAYLIGK